MHIKNKKHGHTACWECLNIPTHQTIWICIAWAVWAGYLSFCEFLLELCFPQAELSMTAWKRNIRGIQESNGQALLKSWGFLFCITLFLLLSLVADNPECAAWITAAMLDTNQQLIMLVKPLTHSKFKSLPGGRIYMCSHMNLRYILFTDVSAFPFSFITNRFLTGWWHFLPLV